MTAISNSLVKATVASIIQARQRSGTGTSTFTGVDVSGLEGQCIAVLDVKFESGTPTLDVKLQESDTLGGTYTDIVGGAFAQVGAADSFQVLKLDIANTKKYVRGSATAGGTSPVYAYNVTLTGMPKYA